MMVVASVGAYPADSLMAGVGTFLKGLKSILFIARPTSLAPGNYKFCNKYTSID
jgi:hypothetical protein